MDQAGQSRREMIRFAAMAAGAMALGSATRADAAQQQITRPQDPWRGLKVGVASYSLRKLNLDAAIKAIRRVGLHYVSIKDFHLKLESTPQQRKDVARKFIDAGITPLSVGVIYMPNDERKVRDAFEYARDVGVPTIVCSPANDSMPLLDRLVREYDIHLAIHNHGPEDKKWPSPYDVLKGVEGLDPRVGICIDVGHTMRVGVRPEEAILRCKDRMFDVHMKDLDKADPKAKEIECGRGILDIPAIFRALLQAKFAGHVGFEHEKDPDDPLPGLAESVGYAKGVLLGLQAD